MVLTEARKEEFLEIEIRGRFMVMAADLEWAMLLIMANCTSNPVEQVRKFKGLMMYNKIEATIADLKTFRPDLLAKYETDLALLWEFRELRNDIAHHKIDFDKDLKSFRFLYADINPKTGVESLFEKRYEVEAIFENIEIFRELILKLTALFLEMGGKGIPPVA